ncbi:Stc1 domain-containing protein [Aspergillus recurvatus]
MANRRLPDDVPSAYARGYSESIKRQWVSDSLISSDNTDADGNLFYSGLRPSLFLTSENQNSPPNSCHLCVTTTRLKCKTCKKFRNINTYSKRQLDIFRNAFVVQGQRALTAGYATCLGCTGGQVMELRCCVCDQVKGLDDFAMNQRKEHEFARCLVCVQGHKDAEPVIDENKLLADGELSYTQGTIRNVGSTLTGPSSRLTSDAPGHGSSFVGVTNNVPSGGGVWVEPERHGMNSSGEQGVSSCGNSQRNLAAFNANSVHGGWASFGVQRSEAAASVRSDDREGKFAKVKAWRPEEVSLNNPIRAREVAKKADYSDEDDEKEDIERFL